MTTTLAKKHLKLTLKHLKHFATYSMKDSLLAAGSEDSEGEMKAFVKNLMYSDYVSLSIKEANNEDHQSYVRIEAQTIKEKGFHVQQELVKVLINNYNDAEESEDNTLMFKGFLDDEVNSNEEDDEKGDKKNNEKNDEKNDEKSDKKSDEKNNKNSNENNDNNETSDEEEENE